MNDREISSASVLLNILAILGFVFVARTPLQTTTDIFGIAAAALGVYGTALVPLAIKTEWLRLSSAALIIILSIAAHAAL